MLVARNTKLLWRIKNGGFKVRYLREDSIKLAEQYQLEEKYNAAIQMFDRGQIPINEFISLNGFKDSEYYLEKLHTLLNLFQGTWVAEINGKTVYLVFNDMESGFTDEKLLGDAFHETIYSILKYSLGRYIITSAGQYPYTKTITFTSTNTIKVETNSTSTTGIFTKINKIISFN